MFSLQRCRDCVPTHQAAAAHGHHLLARLRHDIRAGYLRKRAGHLGRLPQSAHAQRHQLLHRQPCLRRHVGLHRVSPHHAPVKPLHRYVGQTGSWRSQGPEASQERCAWFCMYVLSSTDGEPSVQVTLIQICFKQGPQLLCLPHKTRTKMISISDSTSSFHAGDLICFCCATNLMVGRLELPFQCLRTNQHAGASHDKNYSGALVGGKTNPIILLQSAFWFLFA